MSTAFLPSLKALPRWVRFDLYRDARGKLKKVPRIPGSNAEASNRTSAHWRSFAVAVADALAQDQYVGFVFDRTTPFVFVDLDHALGANGDAAAERGASRGRPAVLHRTVGRRQRIAHHLPWHAARILDPI